MITLMIILGVDPGSRVTGFGLIHASGNRLCCVDFGVFRLVKSNEAPAFPERLKALFEQLDAVLRRYRPGIMAVESVFHASNAKSALTLGHVRGVLLLSAALHRLDVAEYSPLEVKKSVAGYGRADKQQVQTMVKTLLNLKDPPSPHDAADALAIAICQAFNGTALRGARTSWRSFAAAAKG